jgi:hypothetical protein
MRITKREFPEIAAVISAAFPDYRGRKMSIEIRDKPLDVRSYWDGGSRSYFVFVRLADKRCVEMPAQSAFDRPIAGAEKVSLPAGIVCVEHVYFCGKDLGCRVYVNPSDVNPQLLPRGANP